MYPHMEYNGSSLSAPICGVGHLSYTANREFIYNASLMMCVMACSSGPDLTFGPGIANSAVDSMQWHDSASPPTVLPENATIAKSPLRSECDAATKANLDAANLRMEFVTGDARLAQPALEKAQVGVKTAEFMPADERWSGAQSGAQFMASDCLQDGQVSEVRGIANAFSE